MTFRLPILALIALSLASPQAMAQKKPVQSKVQEAAPPPLEQESRPPYDDRLAELSRILGSVQYLRNLCMPGEGDGWREAMETLLNTETAGEPQRRATLTAAFNRGYRAFAAIHVTCTPAAIVAEQQYRNEGATLAAEIASRFGN